MELSGALRAERGDPLRARVQAQRAICAGERLAGIQRSQPGNSAQLHEGAAEPLAHVRVEDSRGGLGVCASSELQTKACSACVYAGVHRL